MRTRRHITKAVLHHDNRQFTITFNLDGIHIREKFAREERIISLVELVGGKLAAGPSRPNPAYANGSPSEALDMAACDLVLIADSLHAKETLDRITLSTVKESASHAMKIIRSLEVLA